VRPKRSKTYHGVSLTELLAAGVLSPGVQLVSTNGSWPAVAEVTQQGGAYAGVEYTSPPGDTRLTARR